MLIIPDIFVFLPRFLAVQLVIFFLFFCILYCRIFQGSLSCAFIDKRFVEFFV